ncbi:MAG: FadR family transcriptional regulator [Novosphingobium sp.]|nr:FadR family transcriptional regulator [Novosphingobium sp.]
MSKSSPKAEPADQASAFATQFGAEPARLYQKVAATLMRDLSNGIYAIGDRMPAERELAAKLGVSRPVVREAMLALEVLGLIEVRIGSGAYVVRLPGTDDEPGFSVSPFELVESRMLIEGEAAALAAAHITEEELARLDALVEAIQAENRRADGQEEADRLFHMTIAAATRNAAIERVVADLWDLRSTSPECALLLEKARTANVRPVVEEHSTIVGALRAKDATGARIAMRRHLEAVTEHLLFAIEEKAVNDARNTVASTRARFGRKRKP